MLVSQFEEIRMEEEKTFGEYYSKLSTIRNYIINLGKKITNARIINKILISLPVRFIPQITAIQLSKDLETMRVEELVGFLQIFELLLPKPKNSKNLALKIKAAKGKSVVHSGEYFRDEEEIASIARKLRKFFRNNGNFRSRESKNFVNPSNEVRDNYEGRKDENHKDKLSSGRKCHECGGIGHIRADCGNLINSKGKAFNMTQSDEPNNEEKAENVANYVAFEVSYDSEHEASESNSLDSEHGICENESKEEGDLQNASNDLYVECIKLKKLNKQHL
jgi:hypothetical protein